MSFCELKKYPPIHPVLKKLVKFYWILKSDKETTVHGKLIPTNNIDLIINHSGPIQYKDRKKENSFPKAHFNGIQNKHRMITQRGPLDIAGISFYPAGFYPFIKVPLAEFANNAISIEYIIPDFERKVECMAEIETISEKISFVEKMLMSMIDLERLPPEKFVLMTNDFLQYAGSINIQNYCKSHGMNQKTTERFFHKYIGTTPKAFLMTTRFQQVLKKLTTGNFDSLTQLGYEFNYYDQTHFINSFKSFTGKTPSRQLKQKDLIIDILKNK
jgi:AraC-like DNA-binding protein